MNKSDLKAGNVVKLKNSGLYLLTANDSLFSLESGQNVTDLKRYNNNLECGNRFLKTFDIVEVYEDYTLKNLLWKRKESVKLTEAERVILSNIDKDYKWIARDKCSELYIFINKPEKDAVWWSDDSDECLKFNHFPQLFQFIKWENDEPYCIADLLKEE